jgi:secondary thiamine-phosphate synthase enzyme
MDPEEATMSERIKVKTKGDGDTVDLTGEVRSALEHSGIRDGVAVVFVPGSTAAITTVEFERGLLQDLKDAFERLVPAGHPYAHNHGGDSNGHAHVRASIVGPSASIPVEEGKLTLGTWQQIVLIDFDDRPRAREVVVQILGD